MAGFLDPQEQIIDMVLTSHGKMLLSQGELRFVYWAAYDDEVQYDLSGTALIEDPLQREAVQGYSLYNLRGQDTCNVNRPLMSVPPGWSIVPSGSISFDRADISMSQQNIVQNYSQTDSSGNLIDAYSSQIDMGIIRFNSNNASISAQYTNDSYQNNHQLEGFYVKILASGTHGYIEQHHTLDDSSEIVVGPDLKLNITSYGK